LPFDAVDVVEKDIKESVKESSRELPMIAEADELRIARMLEGGRNAW
jgi:hypothetical protein